MKWLITGAGVPDTAVVSVDAATLASLVGAFVVAVGDATKGLIDGLQKLVGLI